MAVDAASLGQRIAYARGRAGLTQAELAGQATLDRSALAKVEGGSRRITAVELARIADALETRIDWFLTPAPPSLVDHRNAQELGVATRGIDECIEAAARDVEFVADHDDTWASPDVPAFSPPRTHADAESMAADVRRRLRLGDEPACDLGLLVATLGLTVFSLDLGPREADAATILLKRGGVSVVNGTLHTGRRRLALAHELGHYLSADQFTIDVTLGESMDGVSREARFDRFARALLLPSTVLKRFPGLSSTNADELRSACIRAGSEYRVDMSTLARRLVDLGTCTWDRAGVIRRFRTTKADIIEMNLLTHDELAPPFISRDYEQAVLRLYRAEVISSARAVDLLRNSLEEADLPELPLLPDDAIWSFT
jgi:transcriptional regulator with XRE-family HTH domain/Zn-dependent peptidase ImmA (M78 family)